MNSKNRESWKPRAALNNDLQFVLIMSDRAHQYADQMSYFQISLSLLSLYRAEKNKFIDETTPVGTLKDQFK